MPKLFSLSKLSGVSLKFRVVCIACLTLILFIPLTATTLEQAFNRSLTESMLQQLKIQSLGLISEFEFIDGNPSMPTRLYSDQFNLLNSGLYGFITLADAEPPLVWQSQSSVERPAPDSLNAPDIGQDYLSERVLFSQPSFVYAYTAEFENGDKYPNDYQAVSFFVVQDKHTFDTEKRIFARTLWQWLSLISVLLLASLIISLTLALRPIKRLNQQIQLAKQGQISQLTSTYPEELTPLKSSLNQLLDSEQQQRTRYKNSLSDLAHSLKTPLAILQGNPNLPADTQEPISQIQNQIQRQLKRASVGHGGSFAKPISVAPIVQKLISAMNKVHRAKKLHIESISASDDALFYGDETDLMEMLGNLLDNACKAASHRVSTSIIQQPQKLLIIIEDDGPGIPLEQRQQLLKRGIRLDSYQEGQGIGLAVVSDLVSAYQGLLAIDDSPLGGAALSLQFDRRQ